MFEVELKFPVRDSASLAERLGQLGAEPLGAETHADTYYNHPCRDFAETREALRVRRIDGVPRVTYKGPKLSGEIKARWELEWRLDPGDPDGAKTETLLQSLGFEAVATVLKRRQSFRVIDGDEPLTVTLDQVEQLGSYAEIETVARGEAEVPAARDRVARLAERLGLRTPEPKSYLRMLLERLTSRQNI
jgi:adenylate cyclase class 2